MVNGSAIMLAALVNPALFAAGAGAVAIPIIIHLLARRRFKRIRWAAMDFLVDAERRNRRRINMEDWILLALRCLAVFLIGLLMARPFLPPSGLPAGWRGSEQTERIFVLDDSFSMGYESANGTSFSKAKQAIRRLLSRLFVKYSGAAHAVFRPIKARFTGVSRASPSCLGP